jgi:hypothetical protein
MKQSKRAKSHRCEGHASEHVHGPECGHARIEHEGHVDYVVGDHRHHVIEGRCIDHGKI